MNKLRIGILGASRGFDFADRIPTSYPYAEISAICEFYEPLCQKADQYFKERNRDVACFTDYDDFLNSGIDGVIIANYANEHIPYVLAALEKKIHVLCEDMPVQTLAEAVALCDAVEKSGCVYAYAENCCYFDFTFPFRLHYDAGDIGEAVCLEGTFINDCSPRWHLLTRGIRDHWRNYVPSTFYCSHGIGPLFFSTGLRSTRVNGVEMPRMDYLVENGARSGSAAMELMELSNGGMAKNLNGNLRHPYEISYRIIGSEGTMEVFDHTFRIYRYKGGHEFERTLPPASYYSFPHRPEGDLGAFPNGDLASFGHFIGKILGDPISTKYSIDVYQALDMSLPGLLAYRSILDGGQPYAVPDMRDKAVRQAYANDHYCTDPRTPDPYRLPTSKSGTPEVDENIYKAVQQRFASAHLKPGGN